MHAGRPLTALVADANHPNSVAGIRALGRAGVHVVALGPDRLAAGRWSRFAAARERGDLALAVARRAPAVVYPGEEGTVDALIDLGEAGGAVLPWDLDALGALRAKRALPELAAGHGIGTPATLFDGTAVAMRDAEPPLPAVVKPAFAFTALPTARLVASREEQRALAGELPPSERVIVQEPVSGTLTSLALVVDRHGAVLARFQEEALRTWPRAAGSFAATMSVAPDEELVGRAAAMLAARGYWGLAQLDLVRTPGGWVLLDVNPRFYFCMPLALRCGVNLPAAWHALVEGRPGGNPPDYPAGVRYRWLEGDLYAARHGHLGRLLPRRPLPRAHTMWSRDDPLASALLAADVVRRPLRRRLRSIGGRPC